MANDNPTKSGAGTAVADDEWEYHAPPAGGDDEWEYHEPSAAAPASTPATPAAKPPEQKSWLRRAWDASMPTSGVSDTFSKVGDWAQGKSNAAHEEDLKNAAAGKPSHGYAAYTPAAGYDLLARGAKTLSGATSPGMIAAGAATAVAPEIMGPVLMAHGGLGVVHGVDAMRHGNFSPENVGGTINSAAEVAGGGAATGASGIAPGGKPGLGWNAWRNRAPFERGVTAYQRTIAPEGSPAVEQMDDAETIRRAAPYLAEEGRKTSGPVTSKQPNQPGNPNSGQQTGVMQYRQHAQSAAKNLWETKVDPITHSYDKVPLNQGRVVSDIRGTINPDSPADAARSQAINDLADQYNTPMTVADGMRKVRALNEDRGVQAYEKALPDKQAEMIKADPSLEAKLKAANSLREEVFDSIEKNGTKEDANYIREARKDWGALNQVSDNLGKVTVPTPGSFGQNVLDTAHALVRPKSAGMNAARRLWNNPNKTAAESSRLFANSNAQPRQVPPNATVPWVPTQPPPAIVPPGAPQAPPQVSPQFATEATGTVSGSSPAGAARIAGLLPEQAASQIPPSTATPPVDPYFRYTGIGSIADEGTPITGRAATGTRFGPKGLLPGPIHGTPAQPVGGPPLMGFPADQGMWNLPPRANVQPSFEAPPPRTATPAPGQVLRPGGLGSIADTETPNPYANRTPPEMDRPKPAGGVEHGIQRRTMFEKEADAKAAAAKEPKSKPAEKPTDEQYTEAKNALKTPATLEPEELQKHRATVRAYDAANKEQTAKDVEEVKKTGTANDRPQVKYKPSEKAATMSEERKPLGREFDTDELTHEVTRNQGILDNPDATAEEKESANKFFEENPDRKLEKTSTGENRPPARNWKGAGAKTETGAKTEIKTGENLVGAAQKTATLRDASGKEVGNAMLRDTTDGGKRGLQVSVSQIEEGSRGQGLGKQMYRDIVDHARQNGYDYVESDKQRTGDADRVWESLKNSGEPVRMENGRYVLDVKKAGGEAASAAGGEAPKISTDNNGIKWAEKTVDGRNIKVSVPKRIPDAEVNDYANKMIGEQAKGQSEMHSNLFAKKNSETSGASVDQVFGRDKGAEEKAASEAGERREANKNERLRDRAESAQRVFEGKEPEPHSKVSWLKMGAERAGTEAKPVQHEFTQEEIRNGEHAALADAEATLQSDKSGRYFDERENDDMRSQKEQSSAKGKHAFGTWRGVSSGRGLYPVLSRLPDMSATEVVRALRNPKSPAYQRVVRAAIEANKAEEARSTRLGLNKE